MEYLRCIAVLVKSHRLLQQLNLCIQYTHLGTEVCAVSDELLFLLLLICGLIRHTSTYVCMERHIEYDAYSLIL